MSQKFSIIITSFNQKQFLNDAIKSCLSQKLIDYELIIIDDCSNYGEFDSSEIDKFILSNCSKNLKRYKIIENEMNLGTVKSLNLALKEINNEFVFFLDGDDYFNSDGIINLFSQMIKSDFDMLTGRYFAINESGTTKFKESDVFLDEKIYEIDNYKDYYHGNSFPISFPGSIHRMRTIIDLNYFDEEFDLLHDVSFIAKLLLNRKKIAFLNIYTYNYRIGIGISSNKLNSGFNRLHRDRIIFYEKYILPNQSYLNLKYYEVLKSVRIHRFLDARFQSKDKFLLSKFIVLLKFPDVILISLIARIKMIMNK